MACPVLLGRGWCFDTVWQFHPAEAQVLKRAPYPGQPLLALWRYVSLGAPSPADITPAEVAAILGAGWLLGLVQHVERPSWQADPASGSAHGAAAVAHAQLVDYPPGCHIGLDMEGIGDAGAPVVGHVVAWADAVHDAGYKVLLYVGYDDGLADTDMLRLCAGGYVDALWSDYGPRSLPPGLSFAMKQHAQTTVAGIDVDPDEVLSPGVIAVMGTGATASTDPAPPDVTSGQPDEPHS